MRRLVGSAVLLCVCAFVLPLASFAQSSDPPTSSVTGATPGSDAALTEDETERQSTTSTAINDAAEHNEKAAPRGVIVAAPLPIVSPAIGTGLIPIVGYIFPFSKNDKISPPSTVGAGGLITNNGSRGFVIGGQLFMKKDTYEVTAGYLHGNVDYNLYGIGFVAGNAGLKLPLEQSGEAFFGEVVRRVGWKFFVGPRFVTGNSLVTLRPSSGNVPPIPPNLGLHTTLRALGIRIVRDTRPNHFYPIAGTKLELTFDFFAYALGSKYEFQRYKFNFNKYKSLSKNQVLAYDLYICASGGSPPFYANCIYGTANELRGYTAGQYLDRHMVATQLEYRLSLPKRLGLAGFAGIGEVVPGGSQIFRINHFLPSVGAGPRFALSTKYHVNLRADFAKGKDSWTWSMGVGEAF